MAATVPDLAYGTIVSVSGTTPANVLLTAFFTGKLVSANWTGVERASINTTTLTVTDDLGAMTFLPSDVYDPGLLEVEMQFDSNYAVPFGPTTTSLPTITVTFEDGSKWAAQGGLQSYSIDVPMESGPITARAVFRMTGNITVTAAP
jgi:hypothetical protein